MAPATLRPYRCGVNRPEPDPGAAAMTDPSRSAERPGSEVPPIAVDEAAIILLRIETDEAAARAARDRYGVTPIAPLVPRPAGIDEDVYAIRSAAVLNAGRAEVPGYGGTLYVTATRLVLDGQVTMAILLADIAETALSGERLLLSLRNGEGATLDVGQPRLLRAEIAAVRSLARS